MAEQACRGTAPQGSRGAGARGADSIGGGEWIGGGRPWGPGLGRAPSWSGDAWLGGAAAGADGVVAGSGREAVAWLLGALSAAGARVALPAYSCPALVQAVRMAGAEPLFYPGDAALRPLPGALDRAGADPRVRAIVVTHAFGRLQDAAAAPAAGGRAPVVEDASHTVCNAEGARFLGPGASAGAAASLRKHLPLGSAGAAVRWGGGAHGAGPPGRPSRAVGAFAAAVHRAEAETNPGRRQALLAAAERHLDDAAGPGAEVGTPADADWALLGALAGRPAADLAAWRRRCRDNWRALDEGLRAVPGVRPLHADLGAGVCPLGYVIRHADRGALARRLWGAGIVGTWHWPVAPEARPHLTREERMLAGTILTLPCDGRYGPGDMERVARAVAAARGR